MEGLARRGLADSVNVVITSAHGMADVTREVYFEQFVDVRRRGVRLVEHGALLSFFVDKVRVNNYDFSLLRSYTSINLAYIILCTSPCEYRVHKGSDIQYLNFQTRHRQ